MNNNYTDIIQSIRALCDKALSGMLSLDDLYSRWPERADEIPLFVQVYEDIEDGVEHQPGFLFKSGIDFETWRKSGTYFKIYVDSILLSIEKSPEQLLLCREHIVDKYIIQQAWSIQEIREAISKYLENSKSSKM